MRALFVLAAAVLTAHGAAAADADCLEPFAASPGWACHADLSDGQAMDYCVQHTHTFGQDPAARFFKMKSPGPYVASCSCGAKGKADPAFGESKAVHCVDRATDTVLNGRITARKFAGQTWNLSAGVRSTFTCAPDPVCIVREVLDPDLPAVVAAVDLPLPNGQVRTTLAAGGTIDVAYLGSGCNGYASEAPTFQYRVDAAVPGSFKAFFLYRGEGNVAGSMVVMEPSGEVHCKGNHQDVVVPIQSGTYAVWIAAETPDEVEEVELVGTYLGQP